MGLLHQLLSLIRDPGGLIRWGGYPGMALIVFAETGLMTFFLPGDSLLVVAGLYAAKGDLSLGWLTALLVPAAVLGNISSYVIGLKTGPMLFNRPKSRFFNPDYVRAAHLFYEKHGGKAVIIARFMPIVRTFVPVVAGIAGMNLARYTLFNLIGAAAWILSMTLIGFTLGNLVPNIDKHIEKVIIVVVFLSVLPGIINYLRARRAANAAPASPGEAPGP
ncbi:MAG TPA: VTT domain-containing protein [bacterium]|nr:VTT domain-containing protein [bacterium]